MPRCCKYTYDNGQCTTCGTQTERGLTMDAQENYKDVDGNDITLEKLVKTEPAWAVNVIRHLKSEKSMLIVRLHELLKAAELVDEKESLGLEPGQQLSVQIDLCRRYFRRHESA